MGYTGAGVGVGIIDSGVTEWHDDLTMANGQGQRMAHFADFVNGYTQPYDDFGHGTHVAGIVAGNGRDMNGARTAIAPGAHIVALKALDGQGHGTISMIIAAIDYAVANKDAFNIRVLNLSLGATVTESYHTDPLTLAAKRAVDAGIVVVASAGNKGKGANGQTQYGAIGSPGNAPWVITVGASSHNGTVRRQDDTIAGFSSRGPTKYDFDAKPDLAAPGHGTVSLSDPVSLFYTAKSQYLLGGLLGTSYSPYLTLSGTSMAAPVVAGTVALMLQANPSLTPNLVKAILQFTSQEYPGYDALTQGTGFLNTRGAVVLAEYFQHAAPGTPYPSMNGWSKQIFWGNKRVRGGVPVPGASAWGGDVVWGSTATPSGSHVVWGDNCADASCGGEVLANNDDDNIVWGNSNDDNIVWGNSGNDNIVWGNDCGGEDCDNIAVWGNSDDDNIVWGNAEGIDNIVWGNSDDDNIVWGNSDDDNIVWGNSDDDNIVWGNNGEDNIVWGNSADVGDLLGNTVDTVNQVVGAVVGDETNEVNSLPSSMWDVMFPLDAQWPTTNNAPVTETGSTRCGDDTAGPSDRAGGCTRLGASGCTRNGAAFEIGEKTAWWIWRVVLMEKMPFNSQLDERATNMIRTSTSRPAATTAVTISDWKDGLPVIAGSTFTLRELRVEDAPSLLAMLTTEEVSRFISPPPTTVEGFERFIMWAARAPGRQLCLLRGCAAGLHHRRGHLPTPSPSSTASPMPNGASPLVRSSGARASSLKAPASSWDFAVDVIGIHRLEARAAVANGRGNGALRKIGAVQEGVLRRSFCRNGVYHDQVIWGIVADDWRLQRLSQEPSVATVN